MNNTLLPIAFKILQKCLNLRSGEEFVAITDFTASRLDEAFYEAALMLGATPVFIRLAEGAYLKPSQLVEGIVSSSRALVIHTTKIFPHYLRRKAATKGAKVLSLCMVADDMAERVLDVDYEELKRITQHVAYLFSAAERIFISTPCGTEFCAIIKGQPIIYIDGFADKPGMTSALPAGVVATIPVPETAEGTIVLDASVEGIGLVKEPILLRIQKGRIVEIKGKETAQRFQNMLKNADANAWYLAEIGIGTNPKATYTGHLIEDERVCGSAHVGFGKNTHLGGNIESNLHLDGTMRAPTVYIDNVLLIDQGSLQIA